MIEIKEVRHLYEVEIIEELAKEILVEVYDTIIPADHINYFLNEFQSVKVIQIQISNENFKYYLLKYDTRDVGYFGIQIQNKKLILSKLYIRKSYRGKKIGKTALDFVYKYCLNNQIQIIELMVNRHNQNSIDIYRKYGFKITELVVNSFPNGHTIEDYRMKKNCHDQGESNSVIDL